MRIAFPVTRNPANLGCGAHSLPLCACTTFTVFTGTDGGLMWTFLFVYQLAWLAVAFTIASLFHTVQSAVFFTMFPLLLTLLNSVWAASALPTCWHSPGSQLIRLARAGSFIFPRRKLLLVGEEVPQLNYHFSLRDAPVVQHDQVPCGRDRDY